MKKILLISAIVVMFIGMSTFAGAIESFTAKDVQKNEPLEKNLFLYGKIELIDGEVDGLGGAVWLDIPLGKGKGLMIVSSATFEVLNGSLVVDPIFKEKITIYPGYTVSMSLAYLFYKRKPDTSTQFTYIGGRGFNVAVKKL